MGFANYCMNCGELALENKVYIGKSRKGKKIYTCSENCKEQLSKYKGSNKWERLGDSK